MGLVELAIFSGIISLIAGVFGFTGIAAGFANIAKILFGLFLIIFLVIVGMMFLGVVAIA